MIQKKLMLGAVLISGLALTACGQKNDSANKDSISIAAPAELTTADVSLAMDNQSAEVAQQVNEGLYNFDKNGEITPALADGMPKKLDGGKVYEIKMKHNGRWSNGKPVTAKDFVYGWQRTVDPKTKSQQSYYLDGVKNYKAINEGKLSPKEFGITAVDKYKVRIQLDRPIPYFTSILAMSASFPLYEPYVKEQGKKYGTDAAHTLYNGPFVLKDWTGTNDNWTYAKNDKYREAKKVRLKEIKVNVVKSGQTATNQFDAKEKDLVQLSGQDAKNQADNKDLHVRKVPGTTYLQYNTKQKLFANEKVRQALSYVVNNDQLANKVLQDKSLPAKGFVPYGLKNSATNQDFAKQAGQLTHYDLKKAQKLWKEGLEEEGLQKAEFSILLTDSDNTKKIAEYLQSQFHKLPNTKVTLKPVPFNNRVASAHEGKFDVVLGGWTPTYSDPTDFLNLLVTGNKNNNGQWSDPTYDNLVETANVTYANDPQKRWETMQKANKYVVEKAPVTPLYYISQVYLINPNLKNVVMGPMGFPYYKDAYIK